MGATVATLLKSFQKTASTPDGYLYLTVKNLRGGRYRHSRNYEMAIVKGILMTMGTDGSTVDPDGLDKNDQDKKTPLMIACRMGYREICEVLVDGGADVNKRSSTWETPLIQACRGNSGMFPEMKGADRVGVVEYLLDKGAEIGARDLVGSNAIKWACKNSFDDVIFKLLEHPSFFMMKIDLPIIFQMFDLNGRDDLSDRVQAHFDAEGARLAKQKAKEAQEKYDRQKELLSSYQDKIRFILSFACPDYDKLRICKGEIDAFQETEPEVWKALQPELGAVDEKAKVNKVKKKKLAKKQAGKAVKRERMEHGVIPTPSENADLPKNLPYGTKSWVKCPYEAEWAKESVRVQLQIPHPRNTNNFESDKFVGWKRRGRNRWEPGEEHKAQRKTMSKTKVATGLKAVIEAGRCYVQSKKAIRAKRESVRSAGKSRVVVAKARGKHAPPIFPEA
jgi:hypothetical protein